MKKIELKEIDKLIKENKLGEAELQLSKLGPEFYNNVEYLYLRSQTFYLNKLYYLAIDTLLIALEFEKSNKIYNLIGEIYNVLGNEELSKSFLDLNLRLETSNLLKKELGGIYKKK